MTAQTPAPKANGLGALLASMSSVAPVSQPSVKDNFLTLMVQALASQPAASGQAGAAQPAGAKPAATAAPPPVSDPTAASLLLALLMPPLPVLLEAPLHKSSARSEPVAQSAAPSASSPASSAVENKPAETPAAEKQTDLPVQAATPKEPASKNPAPSGTPAANPSARMNLKPQRDENAGRVEQKLPVTGISAVTSAGTGGASSDSGAKTPLPFSFHEAPSEQVSIIDLSARAVSPAAAPLAEPAATTAVRVSTPAPMERLEQMISSEALTVRQSGAQTLGVALKLDSNTQLFLQLTNNNGLVQASVRCDRGQFSPEESQWAQLQTSLARQNVQLLPMTGGSSMNFQQPSGQQRRQLPAREDWTAGQQPQPRQQNPQNRPRKNWESWA